MQVIQFAFATSCVTWVGFTTNNAVKSSGRVAEAVENATIMMVETSGVAASQTASAWATAGVKMADMWVLLCQVFMGSNVTLMLYAVNWAVSKTSRGRRGWGQQ